MLFHKATSTQCCIFFCKRFRVSRLPATSGAGAGCEQPLKDKLTLHSIFFPPCVTDLTQLLSTIVAAVLPSFSLSFFSQWVGHFAFVIAMPGDANRSLPPFSFSSPPLRNVKIVLNSAAEFLLDELEYCVYSLIKLVCQVFGVPL